MNCELKIKEINLDTFILTGKVFDKKIFNNLIEKIKKTKDDKLSYKTHVRGHITGFECFIKDENFYDFLKLIQPYIRIIYQNNFTIHDAWGNICKYNEEVTEHNHEGITGFCGILYLTGNGPGTYFKQHDLLIEEEIGKFILFHPMLLHSVSKITNNEERITLAFNMNRVKEWADLSEATWVNKNEI
jgi:hypothetical protein